MEPENTAADAEDQKQHALRSSTCKQLAPKCYEAKPFEKTVKTLSGTPWAMLNADCIEAIVSKLSTEDCLCLASAYPGTAVSQEVMRCPSGVLAKQKALYLIMDSYSHSIEDDLWGPPRRMLAHAQLTDFQSNVSKFVVSRARVRQIGFANLKDIFPNVKTLRLLLRLPTAEWLSDIAKVLQMFKDQLVSLQIIIWTRYPIDLLPRGNNPGASAALDNLLTLLNTKGQFLALTHLTLAFDFYIWFNFQVNQDLSLANMLGQLSECFLYLPWANRFLRNHSEVMQANQGLVKFGFASTGAVYGEWLALENCNAQIAAKISYIDPPLCDLSYYQALATRMHLFIMLKSFTFKVSVTATSNLYAEVLANLQGLPNLKSLSIMLHYYDHPRFAQDDFQLIRLPSIEMLELTIKLNADAPHDEGNVINHNILGILAVRQQFPGLKSLKLYVDGQCSICGKLLHSSSNLKCYARLVNPVKGFDQLEVLERLENGIQGGRSSKMLLINRQVLQTITERRNRVMAAAQ